MWHWRKESVGELLQKVQRKTGIECIILDAISRQISCCEFRVSMLFSGVQTLKIEQYYSNSLRQRLFGPIWKE